MASIFESFFSSQKSKEVLARRGAKDNSAKPKKNIFDNNRSSRKTNQFIGADKTMNRRDFLKKGASIAAVAVGAGILENDFAIKTLENSLDKKTSNNDIKAQLKELVADLIDEESRRISEDNARPIKELINYQIEGRIDLTETNTQETLKSYWKKRYKEDPDLRNSLKKAYYEMGAYDEQLKEIFKKVGVPEEFCYLAIPESHWNMKARSGAGAVGPYQFIASTAERWGLKTVKSNDDRMDPLRSGWACASELKYLYDKSGDWDLALSGYNGGQVWGYLHKDYEKNPSLPPYKNFLRYIEAKINATRDEIKRQKYKEYKVVAGDSVGKIAEKFDKKKEEIIFLNRIRDNKIKVGQILKISYSNAEKEKDFNAVIAKAGYFENLTYPAKFNAVNELIKEGFVTAQKRPGEGVTHKVAVMEPTQMKIKASKTKRA